MENKLPESTLTNQQMSNEYTHRLPDPLKEPFKSKDFIWVVVKLGCLSGSLLYYGTYYLGYPKGDPNFDNHPYQSPQPSPREPARSGKRSGGALTSKTMFIAHLGVALFWGP